MHVTLHQTHHTIGDFNEILATVILLSQSSSQNELHLLPELYLTGYPLQDLCIQKPFIDKYLELKSQINHWSLSLSQVEIDLNWTIILGGPDYTLDQNELPLSLTNSAFILRPGKKLERIYNKILLPNYDIFDEKKYFTKGCDPCVLDIEGNKVAILICEDMWYSGHHAEDPVFELQKHCQKMNIKLDLVVNLSAGPFFAGKNKTRIERGREISETFQCPFSYINRVGGEDEILFDGSSFLVYLDNKIIQAKSFKADKLSFDLNSIISQSKSKKNKIKIQNKHENTWESLFTPRLNFKLKSPRLICPKDEELKEILNALIFGIQEYSQKTGFQDFLVALSGGIDSALVLAIIQLSLKKDQTLQAIYMPGFFSHEMSYDLAYQMCKKLKIDFKCMPIKFAHKTLDNLYQDNMKSNLSPLADENIQSRLRGLLLYAHSNSKNKLVLNTSNKSELAVGYSTLYGDSVGAISVIGDLYKTEVFALAKYINKNHDEIIPHKIISRPPSAELRENQQDEDSLPPYDRLDSLLEGILSYQVSQNVLAKIAKNTEELDFIYGQYHKSEYKRNQFCPIIKVRAKSFGFGYRVPICKTKIF